jgi:hypothetical protein
VKQDAPGRLLLLTAASIVLLNVVLAQVIAQRLYPGNGLQVGPAVMALLALVAVGCVASTVMGWRAFLRRQKPGA